MHLELLASKVLFQCGSLTAPVRPGSHVEVCVRVPIRARQQPVATATAPVGLPPVQWVPVLALAGNISLILLLTSGRYGYDGDELYFIAAGDHLSWSYADQSALVPLLANTLDTLFPESLLALRTPAALLVGLGVPLAALITREFGGRSRAQLLAGVAYAASPFVLWSGHLLATVTLDVFLWGLVSYLVLRWVRVRNDRLLLAAGLCTAVALQVKYLIPALWFMLGLSALVAGQHRLLRRPQLWVGALIACVSVLPSIGWQAAHDWPHLHMASAVAEEQEAFQLGRLGFLAWFALYAGPIGLVLIGCGLSHLLRHHQHRFLGWTALGLFVLILLVNGRPYYLIGLFPLVYGVGAVFLQERGPAWSRGPWAAGACVLAMPLVVVLILPVLPLKTAQQNPILVPNILLRSEVGWPGLADDVATAYRSLPASQQANTVVIADAYPHAAALEFYGPDRGLPSVYSGNRGYWYLATPPDSARNAIVVGGSEQLLRKRFDNIRLVGQTGTTGPLRNAVLSNASIWYCSGHREQWSQSWPEWRHMNVNADQ